MLGWLRTVRFELGCEGQVIDNGRGGEGRTWERRGRKGMPSPGNGIHKGHVARSHMMY